MSSSVVVEPGTKSTVGMGQIMLGRDSTCLGTVLGSCIGLTLYHERLRIGALAHVVLPNSHERKGSAGKFADTAVPAMIKMLNAEGANTAGLIAKLAGGANMFGAGLKGPMQIGQSNAKAILKELENLNIKIAGQDIGGAKGRRVDFDCATGVLTINLVGSSPKTI